MNPVTFMAAGTAAVLLALAARPAWAQAGTAVPPAAAPATSAPAAQAPASEPRFDLSVNSAPAAQVFLQLARARATTCWWRPR
jgi:hypothetical protein